MTYQSGSAIAYYILDISDAERKAAQLRGIYQGIRQDASSLATPVVASTNAVGNTNAYATAIATLGTKSTVTASETQLLINRTRELGTTQGLTTDQINAQLAALSREALAVGNVNAALELEDAALGKSAEATAVNEKEVAKLARTLQTQADAELRLAQQNARTLQATGNNTGALQLLTQARGNATNASAQAVASAETQIASLNKTATATGALSGQLSAFLNPLALFTVGMGVAIGVTHSFGEALNFKANLDELNDSNALLLRGTRNVSQAMDEATNFANKYKLTEKETSEAISESIPVIRGSQSSLEDVLSVFTRLTILKPGKTFNDASRALGELQAGNAVSLERIFNVLPDDANRMKEEIKGGADAIQVLSKYLESAGVGTEALELRAKGVKGAFRDAEIAAENVKKAQGEIAASSGGVELVNLYSQLQTGIARYLGGVGGLTEGLRQLDAQAAGTRAGEEAYNQAIAEGKTHTDALALAQKVAAKAASDYAYGQNALTVATYDQVAAFDEDRIAIGKLQIAAGNLKDIGDKARAFGAVLTRTQNERATGRFESLGEQVNQEKQQLQNARELQAAQLNYAQATNNVVEQRKILNDELKAAAGNQTQELNIKAQIAALDKQKEVKPTKGLSGLDRSEIKLAGDLQAQLDEVNRRLANSNLTQQQRNQLLIQQGQLQEKINDAMQKERDLQTNIALDAVHDQQKRIAEARELDGLRRAENSTRFSAAQQVAIRLREQEILLEQQKRSNDITKENYDLNKSVKESGVGAAQTGVGTPQGSTPVSQVPPIGSGFPVGAQGAIPQVQLAGDKQPINITINIDKDGKAMVTPFDAGVTLKLIGNAFGVQASSGGFP